MITLENRQKAEKIFNSKTLKELPQHIEHMNLNSLDEKGQTFLMYYFETLIHEMKVKDRDITNEEIDKILYLINNTDINIYDSYNKNLLILSLTGEKRFPKEVVDLLIEKTDVDKLNNEETTLINLGKRGQLNITQEQLQKIIDKTTVFEIQKSMKFSFSNTDVTILSVWADNLYFSNKSIFTTAAVKQMLKDKKVTKNIYSSFYRALSSNQVLSADLIDSFIEALPNEENPKNKLSGDSFASIVEALKSGKCEFTPNQWSNLLKKVNIQDVAVVSNIFSMRQSLFQVALKNNLQLEESTWIDLMIASDECNEKSYTEIDFIRTNKIRITKSFENLMLQHQSYTESAKRELAATLDFHNLYKRNAEKIEFKDKLNSYREIKNPGESNKFASVKSSHETTRGVFTYLNEYTGFEEASKSKTANYSFLKSQASTIRLPQKKVSFFINFVNKMLKFINPNFLILKDLEHKNIENAESVSLAMEDRNYSYKKELEELSNNIQYCATLNLQGESKTKASELYPRLFKEIKEQCVLDYTRAERGLPRDEKLKETIELLQQSVRNLTIQNLKQRDKNTDVIKRQLTMQASK